MIGEAVWRLFLDVHTLRQLATAEDLAGLEELSAAVIGAVQTRSLTLGRLDAMAGL